MKKITTLLLLCIHFVILNAQTPVLSLEGPAMMNGGEAVVVSLTASSFHNIVGMQYSINWDPGLLEFTGADNFNLTDLDLGDLGTDSIALGYINLIWLDESLQGITVADDTELMQLHFQVTCTDSMQTSIVVFSDTPTDIVIVQNNNGSYDEIPGDFNILVYQSGTSAQSDLLDAIVTDALCNNDSNGSIDLTVNGNNGPYTYLWSNGATTEDLSGVAAGTYTCVVTNAAGCTLANSFSVAEPDPILIESAVISNATCIMDNGSIALIATGGTGTLNYLWSNGQTGATLSNVAAGNYSCVITDANGCSLESENYQVGIEGAPQVTGLVQDVTCAGGNDGSINQEVSGGTVVSFEWSNGAMTEDVNMLLAGIYSCTMTDVNACQFIITYEVSEPDLIVLAGFEITNVTNAGFGSVNITIIGGVGDYTFSWSNGATTEDIDGLAAGVYSCVVTDDAGCSTSIGPFEVMEMVGVTKDKEIKRIRCWPNPASHTLMVQLPQTRETIAYLQLIDLLGKVVFEKNIQSGMTSNEEIRLEVAPYPKGIYVIKGVSEKGALLFSGKILLE